MMSGVLVVDKNAGSLTGAALRGGDVVVRGDVGARSGIDQKGGTILVGGNAGLMTGFMLQRGRQVICGNVGGGLGDSMYDGAIYVGGKVASLGIDCVEAELTDSDDEFLDRKLGIYGLERPAAFRKFVCGRKLWNYDNRTVLGARFARNPIELDIPVYITGMSFGALSLEAKMALAKGASMAGTATCSGEGGMIPPERDLSTKWFYQVIQSRYGFNPHHLMLADGVEFFIGQGCKVGLGGHLMGQKVTEQVAEMRSLPAGIDQRSPARHPDCLGPYDLSLKIQ